MKMKKKLAMMLSVLMMMTSGAVLAEEQAEPAQPVIAETDAAHAVSVAAPGAYITANEDTVTAEITGEAGLAIYAALGEELRMDLRAGDVVRFSGLAAGEYDFEVDYHDVQKGVSAFRTSVSVAGKAPEPEAQPEENAGTAEAAEPEVTEPEVIQPEAAEPEVIEPEATEPEVIEPEAIEPEVIEPEAIEPEATEPEVIQTEAIQLEVTEPEVIQPEVIEPEGTKTEETQPEEKKTVSAPGAVWHVDGDSISVTVSGEPGLRLYVDATIGWDDEVYAGETVVFAGAQPGQSYGLEVDYYDLQEGVSAYRTTIEVPAASGDAQPPAEEIVPPTEEIIPPTEEITPPTEEITPPQGDAVAQFDLAVFQQDGVISAQVTGASMREVEIELLLGGARVDMQSVIGDGSVSFGRQGNGAYTVRAAYVTPAEGISAVEKTVEISGGSSEGAAPDEKKPTIAKIGASVTSGDNWIEVKVTDADEWPLYIAVGDAYKVVFRGESVRFDGLSAGEYEIEADYVDPVSGVTPFRSSVSITKAPAGSIVFSAVGGENRIEVIVSEASTLPVAVTVKKDGAAVASKTLSGGVGKAEFGGLAAGTYAVCVNYDPAQSGIAEKEQTGIIVINPAPAPEFKEIAFSAVGGVQKIDVTVTQASNLPVSVTVTMNGVQVAKKTIAAGVGTVTFDSLAKGAYAVVVNYDPAQNGIAAKEQKDVMVAAEAVGIVLTGATAGEGLLTVTGTAQPGADIALVTTPAAETAAIVRADAQGKFTAKIALKAGTYTKITAICVSDNTVTASLSGTYVVTAPVDQPPLSVDPISSKTQTVLAQTQPGVKVNLRVKAYKYGQTVVADANGLLRYSLPQTYPKGTEVTFTVFYGENNEQSYVKIVNIGKEESYTLLKYGDSGSKVKALTKRLEELGYLDDDTSRYSSAVREAVKLFQEINGLDVDGIAGQKTQEALYSVGALPYGEQGEYPTLVRGDKGLASIYKLQRRLSDLGYYTIAIDGIYGAGTERSVRHFQRINGLSKTGRADNATQMLLYSSSAKPANSASAEDYKLLSRSSTYHPAVVPLQRRLSALGYAVGTVDGYFGSRTYRAVREFQRRNGIKATGIADEETQRVLFSSGAIAASGSSSSSSSGAAYRLLYWGCTGDDVKALQKALLNKGYTQVRTADGIYGQWTYDAVRAFQKDRGLDVDGVAGKATQSALYGVKY